MLAQALRAESRAYLDAHADIVDVTGKRLVVAYGYAKEREVMTGARMVEVKPPRVDDRHDSNARIHTVWLWLDALDMAICARLGDGTDQPVHHGEPGCEYLSIC